MKQEYIEWIDASSTTGWHKESDCELILIRSIGFVTKEDKESLTLSSSWDKDNDLICGSITVPKKWIEKRKKVKV